MTLPYSVQKLHPQIPCSKAITRMVKMISTAPAHSMYLHSFRPNVIGYNVQQHFVISLTWNSKIYKILSDVYRFRLMISAEPIN